MSSDYSIYVLDPVDALTLYDTANGALGGTRADKEPSTDFYGSTAHRNKTGRGLDALLCVYYDPAGDILHEEPDLDLPDHYAKVHLSIGGTGGDRDAIAGRITRSVTEWLEKNQGRWVFYDPQGGSFTRG